MKNQTTVLVTGSSSGIGRETAIACAKKGFTVFVHYRNNKKGADETLAEVQKYSAGKIYKADLTEPSEVKKLFAEIPRDYPRIDMLVNNAGECRMGAFDDLAMWESQWKNIFMTQVYVTNEFLKLPHEKGLRKIVNTSSGYGLPDLAQENYPQYSAAKAAVVNFTCTLAKKYAPSVLVNAVAPGYTSTPAWVGATKEEFETVPKLQRIRRFVKSEEVAAAIVALLENDGITGEIVRVDGGLHLLNLI